jgi:hypothetical protein
MCGISGLLPEIAGLLPLEMSPEKNQKKIS